MDERAERLTDELKSLSEARGRSAADEDKRHSDDKI